MLGYLSLELFAHQCGEGLADEQMSRALAWYDALPRASWRTWAPSRIVAASASPRLSPVTGPRPWRSVMDSCRAGQSFAQKCSTTGQPSSPPASTTGTERPTTSRRPGPWSAATSRPARVTPPAWPPGDPPGRPGAPAPGWPGPLPGAARPPPRPGSAGPRGSRPGSAPG